MIKYLFFLRSQPVSADATGKSNAGFYYSYDKLFIIKTLTSEEVERMHSFLKHYHPVRRKLIKLNHNII